MRFCLALMLCLFSLFSCHFPIPAMVFVGGEDSGHVDGLLIQARFHDIVDIAIDSNGSVFVVDGSNNSIRKVTPEGMVSTIHDIGQWLEKSNINYQQMRKVGRAYIGVDSTDNVFFAYGTCIRKLEKQGEEYIASTFVGTCYDQRRDVDVGIRSPSEYDQYNAELTAAPSRGFQSGLAIDQQDNLYVTNPVLLRISPDKEVTVMKDANGTPLSDTFAHMLIGLDNQLYVQQKSGDSYVRNISVIKNNHGTYEYQSYIPKEPQSGINYFLSFAFNAQGYLYLLGSNQPTGVYMSDPSDPPYQATLQRIAPNQTRVWSWPLPPDVALNKAVLDEKRRVIYTSSPRRNKIYKIPLPDGA